MSMKKCTFILAFLGLFLTSINLQAQDCECTNCPVPITDNGTFQGFLDVTVSGPNDLSSCPLQAVCFTIDHTWVGDLSASLISPNGTNYIVMGDDNNNSGGCGTNADNIDICVTVGTGNPITNNTAYNCNGGNPCLSGDWTAPCGGVTDGSTGVGNPNPGVQAPGCDLNAFNTPGSPANGTWTLQINDLCGADVGFLQNWSLEFACGTDNCITCEADGGTLNQPDVNLCQGNPGLSLNVQPTYPPPAVQPSPAEYSYQFAVVQGGIITSFITGPDMSAQPPGTYQLCGFSYDNGSAPLLGTLIGQNYTVISGLFAAGNGTFCGDFSTNCFNVVITGPPPPPIIVDTVMCVSDCFTAPDGTQCCSPGQCMYDVVLPDGCIQMYTYNITPLTPAMFTSNQEVCPGDSFTAPDGTVIPAGGAQQVTYGCDSIVTYVVMEAPVAAVITPPAPITCTMTSVTLDGSNSIGDQFEWIDPDGNIISTMNTATATMPGTYILNVWNNSVAPPCMDMTTVTVIQDAVPPTPPLPFGPQVVCVGALETYSVNNDPTITNYNWIVNGGTITSGQGTPSINIMWNTIGSWDVCVEANNACGTSAPGCVNVMVDDIPMNTNVFGDDPVCPNTVGNYSASATGTVDTWIWSVNGDGFVTNGQGTANVQVSWGTSGGDVCATPSNSCGVGTQFCFPVTMLGVPQDPIVTGPMEVCPGITTTYTITNPDANATGYSWTVPPCGSIIGAQNGTTIDVLWSAGCGGGDVCATALNACQDSNPGCVSINVAAEPPAPDLIGQSTGCIGIPSFFEVNNPDNTVIYNWTVNGGTINSGQGTSFIDVNWTMTGTAQVCVTSETDCGISPPVCIDVLVDDIPTNTNVLGDNPVCPNSGASYTGTALGTVTSWSWTVTGGTISGNSTGATIQVNWGVTGGQVCGTPMNDCGQGTEFCFDVTMLELPEVPNVSGPTAVCPGETSVYVINNPDPNATGYEWFVPSCGTIVSGQGTDIIDVVWSGTCGGGQVCATALNDCENSIPGCVDVLVAPPPPLPQIIGQPTGCMGVFSIFEIGNPEANTTYTWTVTNGMIDGDGQGTDFIVIDWTFPGVNQVCVVAETNCGTSEEVCVFIEISEIPVQPVIAGPTPLCIGETGTYQVTNNYATPVNYSWVISGGGSFLGGTTGSSVDVGWTQEGTWDVCATVSNDCGDTQTCYAVEVNAGSPPPEIIGASSICAGTESSYSIADPQPNTTYTWTVPGGATFNGQGTDLITVQWGASAGDVCVIATGDCGASPEVCFPVSADAPPTLGDIGGPDVVCDGDFVDYFVGELSNSTYTWTTDCGTITAGNGTSTITLETTDCTTIQSLCRGRH